MMEIDFEDKQMAMEILRHWHGFKYMVTDWFLMFERETGKLARFDPSVKTGRGKKIHTQPS